MFQLQYLQLNQGYSSYIVSMMTLKITYNNRLEFYSYLETGFFSLYANQLIARKTKNWVTPLSSMKLW